MKKIYHLIFCCLITLLASCEKDTDATNFAPEVTTGSATDIYRKGATLAGTIQLTGASVAEEHGILFSEYQSMGEYTKYPVSSDEMDYEVKVQNLQPGKTYYYCAYANSGYSIARGEINSFNTTESNAPVFGDIVIDSIGWGSFRVTTTIIDDGGVTPIISGFCWREGNSGIPTLIDNVVNVPNETGNILTATISGLTPQTEYVIAAYSVNSKGMGFSQGTTIQTERGPGIYSMEDLIAFRDARNAGEDVSKWKTTDGVINIFADIDMSPIENWEPISQILEEEVFEGNNHTIKGLKIDFVLPADDESVQIEHLGFIGSNNGTIRNLTMGEGRIDIELQRDYWGINVGGLVGHNYGTIYNCVNEVDVIEYLYDTKFRTLSVAGIAGRILKGTVENCINRGDIQGSFSINGIGGGYFNDDYIVRGCSNYGTITFNNYETLDGVTASGIASCHSLVKIVDCINYGTINGGQVSWGGGISGAVEGVLESCVNEGVVNGETGGWIGGITASLDEGGSIINCTHKGEVNTTASTTGGITAFINASTYTYKGNVNSGTVNGAAGTDENAIGYITVKNNE